MDKPLRPLDVSGATSFTAGEWSRTGVRGWMAIVAGVPGLDPRPLIGRRPVLIDGTPYTVRGVETFAIHNVTGRPFGLLVESIAGTPMVSK